MIVYMIFVGMSRKYKLVFTTEQLFAKLHSDSVSLFGSDFTRLECLYDMMIEHLCSALEHFACDLKFFRSSQRVF